METQKRTVMELINAHQAINNLLNQVGLPARAAYWLGRNRDQMQPHLKRWQKELDKVFEEVSEEMPAAPFIPPAGYANFKREIERLATIADTTVQTILEVFPKFEVPPSTQPRGIPMEKREEYEKACQKRADVFECELDFMPIEVTDQFDVALQKISGNDQAALSFMFEFPSKLAIVK